MRKYDYSQEVVLKDYEEDFGLEIPRRYDVDMDLTSFVDDFEWQITYKFTDEVRGVPGGYGAKGMSFRRLYVILCEAYNSGIYFVEDYFDNVYPHTMKKEVDAFLDLLKFEIIQEYTERASAVTSAEEKYEEAFQESSESTEEFRSVKGEIASVKAEGGKRVRKDNELDMRFTANKELLLDEILAERKYLSDIKKSRSAYEKRQEARKRLSEFSTFKKQAFASEGNRLAALIKEDISDCLRSGRIPLHPSVLSTKTIYKRTKAGLPEAPKFYASGQLINNLMVFLRLEKKQWQTDTGFTV